MADITKIDTFIQSSPHPAWLATTQGHCVYANPALERLTGFNSDQINQADWRSFLMEEDRAVASASWQRSLATGTPYRVQVRMRRSDGGPPKCVELIAFGHKAGDGTELWLFTGLDPKRITAQKSPELEAQIQATLNVIPAYTWYTLPSGALTFVNERTANYLGLPKDHPLRFGIDTGAEWDSHTALLHPDDREEARRVWSTCLSTGTAGEFTFRVPSAEGKYRWFLTRAEPLRATDGTLLYWIGVNLDIDDAKRAEDALRKSEKELRDVIDTIPAIVWSALPDGSNVYVNRRFIEYSGLSTEQTAGSGWQAAVHPDDLERHAGKWMEAVATGKPHENEVRFRRSDGQYRWHLDRGVPLRDEDGNIIKWYGVVTDIEDRKCAEEALELMSRDLQESKTRLEGAQRIAHVGHWAWDGNDGLTWSDETYRIYGLRPQERPMTVEAFQEMIHPEDREILFQAIQEARGGGFPDIEYRIIHPSGEVRIVHAVTRGMSGQPYQMFGIVQDITDRKRAEKAMEVLSRDLQESKAKLEEAQRITHVGYWEWDILTGRVNLSDETYRIYGLRPQADPIDLATVRELIHPEDREAVFRTAEDAILRGVRYDSEHRLVRPNGEVRTVHSQGELKRDASGQPYQMFGTVQDITDRKLAEEELRRSQFYLSEGQRLAHMGSWAFNRSGFFDYWSQELFKVYGLDPQKGAPTLEQYLATIHPQDRDFMAETVKRMCEQGSGCDVKKRIVRPDGAVRYIRCVGIPVLDNGLLKRFLGTAMDVTEQEQLTQELQRREAYLAGAQRLSQTGSFGWKPNSGEIVWSDETYRIFEYDHAVKPTIDIVVQRVHPEDRTDFLRVTESASSGATQFEHTYRLLLPDGSVKHVYALAQALQDASGNREFVGAATDVTSIKRAEEELRKSKAYLAEAQRLTHTGSWAINVHTDEHFWSEEMFRIHEIDPKLKPDWSLIRDRVHPDDRASLDQRKKIEFTQTGWTDSEADLRIVVADGRIKHLHTIAHPVMDASGQIVEVVGTTMDVTERKRTEDSLRRSESYLAEAQKLTHTGSWVWRVQDRNAVHLSEEWYRIYGFDPAEGAPVWEKRLERVHPEDRRKWKDTIERAIVEKADYDLEFRILLPNGQVKWIRTVGHPVLSNIGDLDQFVGSSTDITERKSAEQALQRSEAYLAEAQRLSHTGSWVWNPASDNTYYSEECFRLLGFDAHGPPPPLEAVIQRIHPDDQAHCSELVEKGVRNKLDFELDYRIVHPDKSIRDIHCVCHPVLDQSGNLVEMVGTLIDVTERKRADELRRAAQQERERLYQLEAQLAHINRVSTLGEMAASLAHEIKQPIAAAITSANSCIEWLAHEPPNLDRARAAAARIDKYGNRAAEIIDRIRSFYKKSPPQREPVDVNGTIQEMLTLLNGEATRSSIAMRMDLSAEMPKVMVDRVQLQQVFMNLMLNAIEAMKDSGGELTVKSELLDGQLQFSVSDTGPGLPAGSVDQIFSAFFTTKPQGSGMGLAISRSIVESQGGRLWATANDGRGATFHFTLPTHVTESSSLVA